MKIFTANIIVKFLTGFIREHISVGDNRRLLSTKEATCYHLLQRGNYSLTPPPKVYQHDNSYKKIQLR